jgi:hypothetical protein
LTALARALVLLAFAVSGCILDDIDYTGKSCPCPEPEYRCNEATATCEAITTSSAQPSAASSSASSSSSSTGGECTPNAAPASFRSGWSTPNAVYWRWDPPPDLEALRSYRVTIGSSAADVEAGSNVTVFDASENAELDGPYLVRTTGVDPVQATFTDGLAQGTTYFARLLTTDTAGCEHTSAVLSASTALEPTDEAAFFIDALPPGGYVNPASIEVGPCAVTGSTCLTYTNTAAEPDFENVRAAFDAVPVSMTDGDFATAAFLEVRVGSSSTAGPTWAEIRLAANGAFFIVGGLVLRADGDMHTYQIPLRMFRSPEGELVRADLAAGVTEIGVGNLWSAGAVVHLDDMRIRW